jgi:hypothetical protein
MSSDGKYQLITSSQNNLVYRSADSGINFYKLNTGILKNKFCLSSTISSRGQYQLIAAGFNDPDWLYSSCISGEDVVLQTAPEEIKIKNANFYIENNNNFFNLSLPTLIGAGNTNITSASGVGTGILLNPTGSVYQSAICYETTLLKGVIEEDASNGVYTWTDLNILSTGNPDKVFSDYITGNIQATGLLIYDTTKLVDNDTIRLNNIDFTYITGLVLSDTDVINYINRVEAADKQSLELSVKSAINNFILGLKEDGIWGNIKASCLMAGPRTVSGAMQPLVGPNPTGIGYIFLNSTYYNRNSGLSSDGASVINTKWLGSANSASNHHNMVYVTSNQANMYTMQTIIGESGYVGYGTNNLQINTYMQYDQFYDVKVQNRSYPSITTKLNSTINGILGTQRNSIEYFELWNNINSQIINTLVKSPPIINSNLYIMGLDGGSDLFAGTIGFYSIGDYISNPVNLQNRLDQYFKDIQIVNNYPRLSTPYSFSTFNQLVSNLNIGATGGYDNTLQTIVGITGQILNNTVNLYSYYLSGEDGNSCTISATTTDPLAIKIPNLYFKSGKYLRTKATKWGGDFYKNIPTVSYTNTGYYKVNFSEELASSNITGVVFENNFSGNWSTYITPISQGIPLDTGNSSNLLYNPINKIFSGNFIIKSGISYLGYSGLNIDINKRMYKQYPLKTISVAPAFNDLKFTVVGTVNDQNLYYDFTNQYAIWYLTYDDVGDYYTYIFTYISDVTGYYPNILNNYYCDNPGTNPIGTYSWGAGFSSQNQSSFEIQENKNLAKYTISGINNQFIFTGILEG